MAYPTDRAINLIRDYVNTSISGGFSNTDVYLSDFLNNPYYQPNPTPQGYIPAAFDATSIFAVLSPSSVKSVLDLTCTTSDVLPLLNGTHDSKNIYLCNVWANAYLTSETYSAQEYVAVTGVINSTVPDPSWSSGVSWAQVNLSRPCDIDDIMYSR